MSPQDQAPGAKERRAGHLLIIGGNEDRDGEMRVLRRFVELTGRSDPRIVVLSAADAEQPALWRQIDQAFADLGVQQRVDLPIASRSAANDSRTADLLLTADGILVAGPDAHRLLALVGGSGVERAMHLALRRNGACLAGTSACASALSQHMMQEDVDTVAAGTRHGLDAGLGLVPRVLIDQHFSERRRLSRLLAVVAHNPALLGIGIDEDTALVIEPQGGLEVIGDGAVTLIDGRRMASSLVKGRQRDALELSDVTLHLLPAGARYSCAADAPAGAPTASALTSARAVPAALQEIVSILTSTGSSQP